MEMFVTILSYFGMFMLGFLSSVVATVLFVKNAKRPATMPYKEEDLDIPDFLKTDPDFTILSYQKH